MSTTKTHWKQLKNPNYLGAYSLIDGKDMTVTIVEVKKEVVKGESGKEDLCTVAHLKDQKPFILNVTNCKTIAKLAGSNYIEDWRGLKMTVGSATTLLKGEQVECLRVRSEKPKEKTKPMLTKESPKWKGASEAIANGTYTIEQLGDFFVITDEIKTELLNLQKVTA